MLNLGRMVLIPITTISKQHEIVENQLIDGVADHIYHHDFVGGSSVTRFEQEFAEYVGTQFAVATNSGTTALWAALTALNLKPTDEVITTSLSFAASTDCIILAGGRPVFADIDPLTGNLNPQQVQKKITKHTKAVVVVHLYGVPANMSELIGICRRAKLTLIEDASHAHGSLYESKRVGSLGDMGCFSLYPAKIIGSLGNAGIVTTNSAELASIVRSFCHHGQAATATSTVGEKYLHRRIGINGGMNAIEATALSLKLPLLDDWITSRRAIADHFNQVLAALKQPGMYLPKEKTSVYTFAFRTKRRAELMEFLTGKEIESRIYYPIPLHLQPSYKHLKYKAGSLPVTEGWAKTIVSLPLYQGMSLVDQRRITTALEEFFG